MQFINALRHHYARTLPKDEEMELVARLETLAASPDPHELFYQWTKENRFNRKAFRFMMNVMTPAGLDELTCLYRRWKDGKL